MTFLIIIGIIALLLGMASRSKSTVNIDNDNAHLFSNSEFKQDKSINKKDLKEEIETLYEKKKYKETKIKILEYLKYYNEDIHINFFLVFSLVELNELDTAEKYAHNVIYQLDSNKIGYYLLGYVKYTQNEIQKSIDYMDRAINYGLPEKLIIEVIHDRHYLNQLFNKNINIEDETDDLPF